jgi:hypothetical protein
MSGSSDFDPTGAAVPQRWRQKHTLQPSYGTTNPLTYYTSLQPILSGSYAVGSTPDRFGYDVSIYGNDIAVGAPLDRKYYEYASSSLYQQGAFYVFSRCPDPADGYHLSLKSNGYANSLKNHRLGYALDLHEDRLLVASPKITAEAVSLTDSGSAGSRITPCYVQGSLYQAHFCRIEDEYHIHGQYCYLQRNTESLAWEEKNTYQCKKQYLEPYRNFGFSVDGSDRFAVVGAPMNISGSNHVLDVYHSGSGDMSDFQPICGQSYVYNYNNYRDSFHIGNVFYRNGKIVLNTSGSVFDSLFLNDVNDESYQYNLSFKNKHTIHEKQVICPVNPGEFNVSTNPTALTYPTSSLDLNRNGHFDFQDVDVLLMYMNLKRTEYTSEQSTVWSSSVFETDSENSWYNYLKDNGGFYGTDALFSSSYASLNTNAFFSTLDFNQDNSIDLNDQNILWKYFSHRLDPSNFDRYITVNSTRRLYGDMLDHINQQTQHQTAPAIKSDFFDYERLTQTDKTGSYLTPYVTSVGLYQAGDLVAIAKLGSPVKLLPEYPYVFNIKIDF